MQDKEEEEFRREKERQQKAAERLARAEEEGLDPEDEDQGKSKTIVHNPDYDGNKENALDITVNRFIVPEAVW